MGKNVKGFEIGDRCVADVGITVSVSLFTPKFENEGTDLFGPMVQCDNCFYCRRGQSLLCESFDARGVTLDGGFAEYIV